jgi:hypothetical protein
MTYAMSDAGATLARLGGALAGPTTKVNIAGTSDAGRHFVVTASADSDGKLKLINWEANL